MEELEALLGEAMTLEDARGRRVYGEARGEDARGHAVRDTDGAVLGELYTTSPRGEHAAGLIARMAEQELSKRALASETLERYHELNLLYDMGNQISRVLDIEDVSRVVVTEAERFLDAASVDLLLRSPHDARLTPVTSSSRLELRLDPAAWDALTQRVFESGQAELAELDGRSAIIAPMRSGEEVLGLLRLVSDGGSPWTAGELKLVSAVASHAAAALHHAILRHDHLRRYALDMLEQHGQMLARITRLEAQDVAQDVAALICRVLDFQASAVLRLDRAGSQVLACHNTTLEELRRLGLPQTLAGREVTDVLTHRDEALPWPELMAAPLDVVIDGRIERFGLCVGLGPSTRSSAALDRKGLEVLAALCSGGMRTVLARQRERVAIEREAEAQAAAEIRGQFLANVSHEIRTPMNAVIGMTEMLLRTPLTPQQRRYAEHVETCGRALLTLINDVLDVSKIEAGKLELHATDFNPRDVLEEAVAMLAKQAHDKGLEVACVIAPELPAWLHGDEDRLRQIVVNLLGNAIKFTEEGEVCIEATLQAREADAARIHVAIRDTGIGISSEAQARIFDSFTQADPSQTRRFGGTGLGTTIAKQLVTLMGGEIDVDSTPGQGSTFWFTARLGAPTSAPPEPPPSCAKRVLIAEPHHSSRAGLVAALRSLGAPCASAESADEALALWREAEAGEEPFDAILLTPEVTPLARALRETSSGARLIGAHTFSQPFPSIAPHPDVDALLIKPPRLKHLRDALEGRGDATVGPRDRRRSQSLRPVRELGQRRVLLVEDNPINQELALDMLRALGCEVQIANNGREAYERIRDPEHGFEIVLMDCQMPVWDGYHTASELRALEALESRERIPIVALTAHALRSEHEKALAAGMDAVITKPISLDALGQALQRWLPDAPSPAESEPAPARPAPSPVAASSPTSAPSTHDLRTPLNAILGYTEMLIEDVQAIAQRLTDTRRDFSRIQSSGHLLLDLIDALPPSRSEPGEATASRAEPENSSTAAPSPLPDAIHARPERARRFLDRAPQLLAELELSVVQQDSAGVARAARELRNEAQACGLDALAEMSGALEARAEHAPADEVALQMTRVASTARSLILLIRQATT